MKTYSPAQNARRWVRAIVAAKEVIGTAVGAALADKDFSSQFSSEERLAILRAADDLTLEWLTGSSDFSQIVLGTKKRGDLLDPRPRRECPACRTMVLITKTGKLRHHSMGERNCTPWRDAPTPHTEAEVADLFQKCSGRNPTPIELELGAAQFKLCPYPAWHECVPGHKGSRCGLPEETVRLAYRESGLVNCPECLARPMR